MVDVIVDQRFLRPIYCLLHSMELLGQVEARPSFVKHANDTPKVSFRAF
jgi:hypothetical protein